ncbi:hypothetical protein KUCAC02_000614 [Chaenocephalus aceratus]|uniref:Uncharacterized protein n=1 Tax=Chaenocephalus aceratus TaxID=36190 RepID=A0ACB9W620_CHAAC|nr:hypothetical protein KUCAC02_000614 [Chaenocephalus aceratus]
MSHPSGRSVLQILAATHRSVKCGIVVPGRCVKVQVNF